MTIQLDRWTGDFGDQYTQRNIVDWRDRIGAWWTMLKGLELRSGLEIGCNRGHNLRAIYISGRGEIGVHGIEPNPLACQLTANEGFSVYRSIDGPPLPADLVFTCGVLIHVPPNELDATLRKIHALSRKYVLCIEYFADQETAVEYRGFTDMLWKRNWPHEYESRFPDLKLIRSGFWGKDAGFDDVHWWLWEKNR
mgnify:CR=1 FL=1